LFLTRQCAKGNRNPLLRIIRYPIGENGEGNTAFGPVIMSTIVPRSLPWGFLTVAPRSRDVSPLPDIISSPVDLASETPKINTKPSAAAIIIFLMPRLSFLKGISKFLPL
jgi:hypothetical protein